MIRTLTAHQVKLLKAVLDSDYHDGQEKVGNHVWSDGIHSDVGVTNREIGGIVSAAQQAGLITTNGSWDPGAHRSDRTIAITQLGMDSYNATLESR